MRLWEIASLLVFAYAAIVAALPRRPAPVHPPRILAGSAAGVMLTVVVSQVTHQPLLHDWVAPPALLLLAYWTTGRLFAAPRAHHERALIAIDRRLDIRGWSRRAPRWLAELLELAYLGVYPLIPIALLLHLRFSPHPDPTWFWTVILISDFLCFAVLPWVQTRPPRALEDGDPWRSSIRPWNLRVLGTASIRVNTFPSGHAAEGLACALLLVDVPWPIVAGMLLTALAISAGAVLGRYHYAADAICGWLVALIVWMLVPRP